MQKPINPDCPLEPYQFLPPARGKVGMGVEQWKGGVSTTSLMKPLATRLGWQKTPTKSLVIALPLQGGGDISANGLFGMKGFTLIEILVVLVIIGLLAGVALPRLYAISQRYEIAAQRESILTEISNLGYRAYSSGQPTELASLASPTPNNAPINIPQGWRIEARQPIRYSFNGICSGGKIILFGPDEFREELQLATPLCKPANN